VRPWAEYAASEWRKLGFHFAREGEAYVFTGSRRGLVNLPKLLRECADGLTERWGHNHYDPYMSLEIGLADCAALDEHSIRGTTEDLRALARTLEERLLNVAPESRLLIRWPDPASAWAIELVLAAEGFDPASLDPSTTQRAARE
jgi:hypothetical protein